MVPRSVSFTGKRDNAGHEKTTVNKLAIIPGQAPSSHALVSLVAPVQGFPPWAGAGAVQDLARDFVPVRQETEHADQLDHAVKFPFTVKQ